MSPNDANKQTTSKQKDAGYQDPTARSTDAETDSEQASMDSFDTPDEKLGEDAAASEAQSTPEGVGRDILDVKNGIQAMLRDNATNGVQSMDADDGSSNILGVGIGFGRPREPPEVGL